jgi:hypothetical protein
MRLIAILVCAASLVVVQAQSAPKAPPPGRPVPAKPLLPDAFAGWVEDGATKPLPDPATADAANAAALKEYGFETGFAAAYTRDGETLTIKALQFDDVSGSYGAYSFYRVNGWPREEIGSGAASDNNRVLFWRGTTVIDATFSKVHAESASELRELAAGLPEAAGNKAITPPVLDLLPRNSLEGQTMHYALGPAGYAGSGGVLPAQLVGFDRDAEAVTANYSLSSGPATLTLIEYPTPQMAAAAEAQLRAYIKSGGKPQPFTKALTDSDQASLEVRRTGQVVALVSGDAIPDESHKLIEMVHYSSDMTKIPQPGISEVAKTASLLMNISVFVLVGSVAAILLGLMLGGGRALYRLARGKPVSSVYEAEFTKLDLKD